MFSGCRSALVVCFMLALWNTLANARELRVCADPNNLPFSNKRREGFENKIVELVAGDLDAQLHYTWWAQRRGFIRNTLGAHLCDLVPGTIAGLPMLRTTAPYYRSSYVFVSRPGHMRSRHSTIPRFGLQRSAFTSSAMTGSTFRLLTRSQIVAS